MDMNIDEQRRLEALRLFLETAERLPVDKDDWDWIQEMAAYLRNGTVPDFEKGDNAADLPPTLNNQLNVQ